LVSQDSPATLAAVASSAQLAMVCDCDRCDSWGVDLFVGPGNDLVAVLDVLRLSTSRCVPVFASNVALGLDGGSGRLLRSGNAVGLRLLKLGKTSVCGSRIRTSRDSIVEGSLGSRFGVGFFGSDRCVLEGGLPDLRDWSDLLAIVRE
jgi:hypothetical protein